ncbi:MAG: 5-methyltetrahydrofolate--homocysteine methyltransferase [Prevotellaceae bacterium]|jgi:5-methyltetrahydrofolate--homocysteine methyltransferase|nr:5-methyltetrahydrofolate--homocysteine methyltransferase [Prevotellaceae bacterium]
MLKIINNIATDRLLPYIEWSYFFKTWQLNGKFPGIEQLCDCQSCEMAWLAQAKDREKAKEALKLFRDAQAMLRQIIESQSLNIRALFGLFPAHSENDDIVVNKKYRLPMLRQQEAKNDNAPYLSLADFISPENDRIGLFAVSVSGADVLEKILENDDDIFNALLLKSLADRLAEAAAEWLHEQVRKDFWGYAKDETLSVEEMKRSRYQGIRPAVGYPSLPDQSLIFRINELIPLDKIGITLTRNGAMLPHSSICGMMISHPKSAYFMVGKIGEDQLADYARRSGKPTDEMRKWLGRNLR